MADPVPEVTGTTHTYIAKAWYKDSATLFLLASIAFQLVQDQWFVDNFIPHQYHEWIGKIILLVALVNRIALTKRPVALSDGTAVTVGSIAPKELK
jgi:uncharacterized membrane protein YcjF (UPF0283 family)